MGVEVVVEEVEEVEEVGAPELSTGRVVVGLLDVGALRGGASDPNHPQELVYIWGTGVEEVEWGWR